MATPCPTSRYCRLCFQDYDSGVSIGVLGLSLLGDFELPWREFPEIPSKSPHFKQAIFYSNTVTTKYQVLITHASQALSIRYCKSDAPWLALMDTIFDGLVSEAEMTSLESSSKKEARIRGLQFSSSATGYCWNLYTLFHRSGPVWSKIIPYLLTGLVYLFR